MIYFVAPVKSAAFLGVYLFLVCVLLLEADVGEKLEISRAEGMYWYRDCAGE